MVLWFCNQVEEGGEGSANTLNKLIPELNTEAMAVGDIIDIFRNIAT